MKYTFDNKSFGKWTKAYNFCATRYLVVVSFVGNFESDVNPHRNKR